MKFKLLFWVSLLLLANSAIAQWHFTASIVSYSENCNSNIQAAVAVNARKTIVEDLSGKTYSSQEECESARRVCTMNYSNSGCYIRTTTTPCQGNTSAGGFYGEPSQHDGLGIGGEYFSQNETYRVENGMRENELLVQNEVLNKNWYNAVGAKTGDKEYDNKYVEEFMRLVNKFSKTKDENYDNQNIYQIVPRSEIDWENATPNIFQTVTPDYYEVHNDYGPIVDVDYKRFLHDETYMKSFEEEHPEIFARRNDNKKFINVETALIDLASSAYHFGSGLLKKLDEAAEYCATNYGVLIPYSEKISGFRAALDGDLKIVGRSFVGDIVGTVGEFNDKVVGEIIDPLKDNAIELASATLDAGKTIKNVFVVKNALVGVTNSHWEIFKKGSIRLVQDKNPYPNSELDFVTIKSEKTIWKATKDIMENH